MFFNFEDFHCTYRVYRTIRVNLDKTVEAHRLVCPPHKIGNRLVGSQVDNVGPARFPYSRLSCIFPVNGECDCLAIE